MAHERSTHGRQHIRAHGRWAHADAYPTDACPAAAWSRDGHQDEEGQDTARTMRTKDTTAAAESTEAAMDSLQTDTKAEDRIWRPPTGSRQRALQKISA